MSSIAAASLDRRFLVPSGGDRVRRVADVAVGVLSLSGILILGSIAVPASGAESALEDLIAALPGWFGALWRMVLVAAVLWCIVVPVVAVVRRPAVARDIVLAAAVAVGIAVACGAVVTGDGLSGFVWFVRSTPGTYPAIVLAAVTAVTATARAHLTTSMARVGRWLLGLSMLGALLTELTSPLGAAMALLVGLLASSLVHLVFGTSQGVPEPHEVSDALGDLGLEVGELHSAQRQRAGVFTLDGTTATGGPLLVKVYGRDARDTQAVARLWRGLWYRSGEAPTLSRAQQVEREAFATLLLGSRGAVVPEVLVTGVDGDDDALLALGPVGTPFGSPDMTPVTDAELARMWELVDVAHGANLGFGDLTPEVFARLDHDAGVGLAELGTVATATSPDVRQIDRAQLLVATVCVADSDRAVAVARHHLGDEALGEVLAYLQPAALGTGLRALARAEGVKMAALRDAVIEETAQEAPPVARLRRVSGAALGRMALLTLVAYALISAVTKVDTAELAETFRDAEWVWVAIALVIAQLAIASQAVTTQGASPRRIPYGPLTLLQFSIAFIALAIPSSAARVATVIRFFQKHGVAPAAATAVSAVDSFSGFLVQIVVLVLTLVVGLGDVQLEWPERTGSAAQGATTLLAALAVIAVVVVIGAAVALVLARGLRRRLAERIRPYVADVGSIVRGVMVPRRLVQVIGGNAVTQVLFALCLGACVRAFGGDVTVADALVVYIAAALFGGFMPVPGGIGVMEAALTAGLEAAGVPAAPAFGAAITFRLCTFYLPPIWGGLAFGALQRRGDL